MAEKIDCTLDDVAAALRCLDASDTELWVKMGMAIKREYGNDGFDTWNDWGSNYAGHSDKESKTRWKSFKVSGVRGTVTIGSLFHLAMERGFTFERPELTPEQQAKFAAEQDERRAALAAKWAQEEADQLRWYDVVADACARLMPHLRTVGNSPYLGKKKIASCGCYFAPCSFILHFKADFTIDILTGEQTHGFFEQNKKDKAAGIENVFIYFKRGSILLPLSNDAGELRNFQLIYNDGKSKRFFTNGQKSGLWFVIGDLNADLSAPILFCEGFATGASLYMACGWPVVVCFDAGNMVAVAESWRGCDRKKIFVGDNDWKVALAPKKKNTGLVKSQAAANVAHGTWCIPEFGQASLDKFEGDEKAPSDFNDLHLGEGLAIVKQQLELVSERAAAPVVETFSDSPPDFGDIPIDAYEGDIAQDSQNQSGEVRQPLKGVKTVFTIENLLSRFKFVAQSGGVWDVEKESHLKKTVFNDLVGKSLADEWRTHPDREEIDLDEIRTFVAHRNKIEREAAYSEDEKWKLRFTYTERYEIKADIANTRLVLENDERWRGVVAYCQFSYRVLKRVAPPFSNGLEGEWSDADTDRLRIWLSDNYRFTPKTADALGAVVVVAEANGFHPVREYLQGIKWDGQHRFGAWLHYYLGAEQTVYNSLVGRMFMIGAIARVMQPPVKMDNVLIFEGLQGLGKSTALRILADPWFTDTPLVLGDKDGFQQMQGVWIIELAELDSFNRAEHTRAKQFFGSQTDRYRPSYGRMTVTFPRQCVFAGTTNQSEYLRDATGNRRYWPVKCTRMEAELLKRDRDQLWAEAFSAYQQGEKWWPSEIHRSLFEDQQEQRFDCDVWEEMIDKWLASITRNRVIMSEIMEEALGLEASQMKPPEQKRVGQIMAHLGWYKNRPSSGGDRSYAYNRPSTDKRAA